MLIKTQCPEILEPLYNDYLRYVILEGGRGGMKSHGVATSQLIRGMKRPMLFLDAREIQRSIADSVHYLLEKKINDLGIASFYKVLDTEIRGENGTKFIFAGLRHNITNIKSIEDVDECWVEEAQTVSDATWETLIPTIRKEISPCCFVSLGIGAGDSKPCSKCGEQIPLSKVIPSRIIVTFNPDLDTDPTYQRFIVKTPTNSAKVKTSYKDNPWFTGVLRQEMEDLKASDYKKYLHVYEGFCKAAVEGAIYADALQKARDQGRIGSFKYDDRYPVSAFADIGWADNTSWWFLQLINGRPRVIDCYQNQFKKTPHYIEVLEARKYRYDRIVLPHDAANEHANAERTWLQIFQKGFPNANVYAGKRQAIELRLEATKNMFDLADIDQENCKDGLFALAHYHYAVDPETGRTTREPFHGPESNYSDAFGYMWLEMVEARKPKARNKHSIYAGVG